MYVMYSLVCDRQMDKLYVDLDSAKRFCCEINFESSGDHYSYWKYYTLNDNVL